MIRIANVIIYGKLLLVQIIQILKLKKDKRTPDLIELQYENGIWAKDLRRVELANSLEEYLFPEDKNQLLRRSGQYFAKIQLNLEFLRSKENLLRNLLGSEKSLGELGCGSGWNLMVLRANGFKGELYGADISETGLKVIEIANKRWNLQIQTELLDLNSSRVVGSKTISAPDALFTYLALEQLPLTASHVLREITQRFPQKKLILIESACGLFPIHYSEVLSKIYVARRNYLSNPSKILSDLSVNFKVSRLRFSHRIGNEIASYQIN